MLTSLLFIYFSEQISYQQSRLTTKNIASSCVSLIENNISQALSATYPLATLIRTQRVGSVGFEGLVTEMISFYPGVGSLQLQPDGIISDIVPLKGNEGAIGQNVLSDPK